MSVDGTLYICVLNRRVPVVAELVEELDDEFLPRKGGDSPETTKRRL